jgi:two-component system, NtrC family, sensor histidine kinase HydH
MSFAPMRLRVPLGIQVGVVAALFVAALMVLWATGASVVARERRRSEAKGLLDRAGEELASGGREIIARTGEFPDYPEEPSRDELDRELSAKATAAVARHEGTEGGYLVLRYKSFLGTATPGGKPAPHANAGKRSNTSAEGRGESRLPPLEADLIDIQVDAAIRKKQALFSVEELEGGRPVTVAIRTEPLIVQGRVVGAVWVMTRLIDPLFVDRSLQGYRLATGLALGGIVLSFALTAGLARTVRRQAAERDRLQTDLRRSERLAALGKLLAGVAHEVRNPLAGIRSTAQLWQRGFELDAESLGGLVHEVDRLEEIVSRLLQFSRADAQDLAPGNLNDVLAEAARLAAGPAELKGVQIEVELDPDLPPVEMAPPALLQVFRNLTTNAIHAMKNGGTLRLTTRRHPSSRAAQALISDTGPGLAPEVIRHLFEPFFTTKSEGTGLGLAIAREIALAHRGDLGAANRTDSPGAVFTLTLPVAESRAMENSDDRNLCQSPGG